MCSVGAVIASFVLEMSGSIPFTVMTNIFVVEFAELSETFMRTPISFYQPNCNFFVDSVDREVQDNKNR